MSGTDLLAAADAHGTSFLPGRLFYARPPADDHVRLSRRGVHNGLSTIGVPSRPMRTPLALLCRSTSLLRLPNFSFVPVVSRSWAIPRSNASSGVGPPFVTSSAIQ